MEGRNVISGFGMGAGPEINIHHSFWRDIFAALAAHAMIGVTNGANVKARADWIAETAYLFADKMLAARERDAEERDEKPAA
jgi:hypothetical protein